MADVLGGGSTGLLVRDYKGEDATAVVYKPAVADGPRCPPLAGVQLLCVDDERGPLFERAREAWEKQQA